jgi:AraC-like DNA-binding protein
VRAAADVGDYVKNPIGRFFGHRTFLHAFPLPSACSLVLWGQPDEHDARLIAGAIDAEAPEHSSVHVSFVDARGLTGIDSAGFDVLVDYFREASPRIAPNVTRQALLVAPGVTGAVVAGFWDIAPAVYRDRAAPFTDMAKALHWVNLKAEQVLPHLDVARAEISGTPPAVQALRSMVEAEPRLALAMAARKMGLSARTLQEQLRAAGTNFRRELNAARVRSAQVMLATSNTKLTAIALEVGCGSLQHFSSLFRKETGEPPSAWRDRNRVS